jgi:hypothetical protein
VSTTPRKRSRTISDVAPGPMKPNRLCCCSPRAYVWIETTSTSIFVEQSIHVSRHLDVKRHLTTHANADAKPLVESRVMSDASVQPPGGPSVSADSMGAARSADNTASDSGTAVDDEVKKDVTVEKDQGKVYRTDTYTVHWQAEGEGDLKVSLQVTGIVSFSADWLPRSGSIRRSINYILHGPAYDPGGGMEVLATLVVESCMDSVQQDSRAMRP